MRFLNKLINKETRAPQNKSQTINLFRFI